MRIEQMMQRRDDTCPSLSDYLVIDKDKGCTSNARPLTWTEDVAIRLHLQKCRNNSMNPVVLTL